MQVLRYENSREEILAPSPSPKIFLAGPTVRGNQPHLTSWRFEAVELFEKNGFDGTLIIPEFTVRIESDLGKGWIPIWEFEGLQEADCILFWIPRTRELIGLTTNYELGYWVARERQKVIYGRPDDAYRISYPDIMWEADAQDGESVEIFNTLESTVIGAIELSTRQYRLNRPHAYIRPATVK